MNTTPFSVSEPKNTLLTFHPIFLPFTLAQYKISDRNSLDELEKKLVTGLGIIDKSFFNPLLHIVVPEQHLVFCHLLNLQKSFCKKKDFLRNVETWSLTCTVLIFPAALHDLIPPSLNCWKLWSCGNWLDRNANPKIPMKIVS